MRSISRVRIAKCLGVRGVKTAEQILAAIQRMPANKPAWPVGLNGRALALGVLGCTDALFRRADQSADPIQTLAYRDRPYGGDPSHVQVDNSLCTCGNEVLGP